MTSIHMVMGLSTSLNLKIEQMDVKTVFLHGDLEEKIYMEQPKGFEVKGKASSVLFVKFCFTISTACSVFIGFNYESHRT